MKCTTCGHETQPGAKFCVQCGTTVVAASPPAGMAPLAAPSVTPRPAATAPQSPSLASATAARAAYTPPLASAGPGPVPGTAPTATPAPAAGTQHLGRIAGVLALIAVLGIGSFVAYKMIFPAQPKESLTTTDTPKAVQSPAAQAPVDAAKEGTASPTNNVSSQQTPATPPAPDTKATTATPAAPQAPNMAKSPTGVPAAPRTGSAQTKPGSATGKTDPMLSTPAAPAPASTRQAAAPAAPAPQPDRWELMRQAYEVCSRESMFERLACNQRVGQQYCKGYWGMVPQCPAGVYGDRAN